MSEPNHKQISKDLAEAKRSLDLFGQRYAMNVEREQIARCLYWLGDPEPPEHLRRIVEGFDPNSAYARNPTQLGNFYGMLGDREQSRLYLKRAWDLTRTHLDEDNDQSVAQAVEAAFLAGGYAEATRLAERHRQLDRDPGLRVHPATGRTGGPDPGARPPIWVSLWDKIDHQAIHQLGVGVYFLLR